MAQWLYGHAEELQIMLLRQAELLTALAALVTPLSMMSAFSQSYRAEHGVRGIRAYRQALQEVRAGSTQEVDAIWAELEGGSTEALEQQFELLEDLVRTLRAVLPIIRNFACLALPQANEGEEGPVRNIPETRAERRARQRREHRAALALLLAQANQPPPPPGPPPPEGEVSTVASGGNSSGGDTQDPVAAGFN
ncbi:MAG: hypothetical protein GY772_16075 [bacterium]|nr:hypothetical protein [bacterium]